MPVRFILQIARSSLRKLRRSTDDRKPEARPPSTGSVDSAFTFFAEKSEESEKKKEVDLENSETEAEIEARLRHHLKVEEQFKKARSEQPYVGANRSSIYGFTASSSEDDGDSAIDGCSRSSTITSVCSTLPSRCPSVASECPEPPAQWPNAEVFDGHQFVNIPERRNRLAALMSGRKSLHSQKFIH
ncbi:unnamed protein product [Caenorhabditis sp. 36 PRJEB53466]|nr:unnamed protein product [Caenorhabditis sp. 36 PRJEB53466]